MAGAFEIVMNERKQLVDKVISMMEQGHSFGNMPAWNSGIFLPGNPLSNVRYKGGNKLKLMMEAAINQYDDPRWATARQYNEKGYRIKAGEHGCICEKWIFEKEKRVKQSDGSVQIERVELERPQVSYFRVFNAKQVEGFPELKLPEPCKEDPQVAEVIDHLMDTSECPIYESNQGSSYYSVTKDEIHLPDRRVFKSLPTFASVLAHEMSHATGAKGRLGRPMSGTFGSPEYAKEELRAELGALFITSDLLIPQSSEVMEDHSDYLKSWISVLQDDPNELYRAAADAEKITVRVMDHYKQKYKMPEQDMPWEKDTPMFTRDNLAQPVTAVHNRR